MAKSKVIIKKDLLNVMAKVRKYYKTESGSEEENDAYKEWVELCSKTFGDTLFSKQASRLKDLTRYLRDFDNKKVIKVFQALGYKVIDNWADYTKEKIYSKLCSGCINEKRCHETCEHCDTYYEELEKKGIEED